MFARMFDCKGCVVERRGGDAARGGSFGCCCDFDRRHLRRNRAGCLAADTSE
jgi:hypothetical protein